MRNRKPLKKGERRKLKLRVKLYAILSFLLCIAVLFSYSALGVKVVENQDAGQNKYIKWMSFDVPDDALVKAMRIDISSHSGKTNISWIEVLSYLATKYGGNWKRYQAKDMDAVVTKLKTGVSMSDLTSPMKNYNYYYEAYDAVLHGFLGEYKTVDSNGKLLDKYGLMVYSPIAGGYSYGHYDDFGDSRSFGFRRRHLGNDLMGNIGTPIIAVESGVVETMGWNRYGGWRIGIRSFDHKRYYYYAHMRKNHPYVNNLKQGMLVKGGQVIGYLGMTGYSDKENVNNMQKPHLHFGMEIIFDESQKESNNEIWIDVYDIVNVLSQNKATVKKDTYSTDYYSVLY
jgi:peptidoglycan LD-endopeptidase LytH